MKLSELLKDIEIIMATADLDMEISDISYDSRKTRSGDLFVAIKGFESDGHKFISAAREKGAVAVICEIVPDSDLPYIIVENSRLALALASRNFFDNPAGEMEIIGVTGTNGKTTTTMLTKQVIEACTGKKLALIGTNHNMIGMEILETEHTTPESYELQKLFRRMADAGCDAVVMEVSSHALALERVAGVHFSIAVFTNLTQDHLDFHHSMEEYAEAKAKLFERCDRAVINLDDSWGEFMCERAACSVFTYSESDLAADLIAKDIRLSPSDVRFVALVGQTEIERVSLGVPGSFSVYNAMSTIAAAHLFGISLKEVSAALKNVSGVKGRVEVVPTPEDYTILIDYAHTPDALQNVLCSMSEVSAGRVVAVFGCGGDRDKGKRPIMGNIGTQYSDYAIITSDNPRTEDPAAIIADIVAGVREPKSKYTVIEDRAKAICYAIDNHQPGDVIILAGKGHETYQIIGKERHHMDEREIVAEHIAQK